MGICLSCRRRKRRAPEKRKVGRPPCRGTQPLYAFTGRSPSRPSSPPPATLTLIDVDGTCDLIKFTHSEREDIAIANMANTISNLTKLNPLKEIVSKKKIRFTQEGFNLDLAYITPNLIAMGFPAEKLEGYYRNHIDDVYRFLETKHKDHYKIYNLCSERTYTYAKFSDKVVKYPFDDHNPPKLELIQTFCEDVHRWLKLSNENVAAIHCKAGKGRTGTMVCCYLLHCRRYDTAEKALSHYGEQRTRDRKGVTIPSQRRYVEYYAKLLKDTEKYRPEVLKLKCLKMRPVTTFSAAHPVLEICLYFADQHKIFKSVQKNGECLEVNLEGEVISGDVRVEVCTKSKVIMGKDRLYHFWFNTFCVMRGLHGKPVFSDDDCGQEFRVLLDKMQLDDAHKDKQHKIFPADFQVELELGYMAPLELKEPTRPLLPTPTASPSTTDSSSDDSGGVWADYVPDATVDDYQGCSGCMQADCQSISETRSGEFAAGSGVSEQEYCEVLPVGNCQSVGSQDHLILTDDWSADLTAHNVRLRSHFRTDDSFHQSSYERRKNENKVVSADETLTMHLSNYSTYGGIHKQCVTRHSMSRTVKYQSSPTGDEETGSRVGPAEHNKEWTTGEAMPRPRLSLGDVRASWRDFSEIHLGSDTKHKMKAK